MCSLWSKHFRRLIEYLYIYSTQLLQSQRGQTRGHRHHAAQPTDAQDTVQSVALQAAADAGASTAERGAGRTVHPRSHATAGSGWWTNEAEWCDG